MKIYTDEDVIEMLRADVEESGLSCNKFARQNGLERSTIHYMLNGTYKKASPTICKFYGLKTVYVQK